MEFRAAGHAGLDAYADAVHQVVDRFELVEPVASATNTFIRDAKTINICTARHAQRSSPPSARTCPRGTTRITEDFAVPPERLVDACADLLARPVLMLPPAMFCSRKFKSPLSGPCRVSRRCAATTPRSGW